VPVSLGGSPIGQFDVAAGVPTQKTDTVQVGEFEVTPGSGDIEIPLDGITVNTANGGAKVRLTQQQTGVCSTACLAAGVDSATCEEVCSQNRLLITVWIGDDQNTVCDDGDEYEAVVQLDDNGDPTSVSISPSQLTQNTIDLLNSGSFAICVEVISPVTGEILIDELVFNLGL
jgi:hypothetical protein